MLRPSLGKIASPQNPKRPSSGQGRRPQVDHLHESVVLSSSRGALKNKKNLQEFPWCAQGTQQGQTLRGVKSQVFLIKFWRKNEVLFVLIKISEGFKIFEFI
jgi:hypothetical protein